MGLEVEKYCHNIDNGFFLIYFDSNNALHFLILSLAFPTFFSQLRKILRTESALKKNKEKWLNDADVAIWNRERKYKYYSLWRLAAGDRYIIALCTAAERPQESQSPPKPRQHHAININKREGLRCPWAQHRG